MSVHRVPTYTLELIRIRRLLRLSRLLVRLPRDKVIMANVRPRGVHDAYSTVKVDVTTLERLIAHAPHALQPRMIQASKDFNVVGMPPATLAPGTMIERADIGVNETTI